MAMPEFGEYTSGYGAELKCPSCGVNYLNHEKVEVFERSEDDKDGVHVVVEGLEARINQDLSGNPSARRHGLLITFSCEGCPQKSVLSISQHKGNTFVEFRAET